MRLGLVGLGRMGQVLADKMVARANLVVYDNKPERVKAIGELLPALAVNGIAELKECQVVILAVPDKEVLKCVKELNRLNASIIVVNIATNITQSILEQNVEEPLQGIGVKIIGQAKQIALGGRPLIIADNRKPHLVPMVKSLFQDIGEVICGDSDQVAGINTLAAKAVLEACVAIEKLLISQGIIDTNILKSAIGQVGAGTMKAYADDDLGPFAKDIVAVIKEQE